MTNKRLARARARIANNNVRVYQLIRDKEGLLKVFKSIGDKDTVDLREHAEQTGRKPEFITLPFNVDPAKHFEKLVAKEALDRARVAAEVARQELDTHNASHRTLTEELELNHKAVEVLNDLADSWGFDPETQTVALFNTFNLEKNEHSSLHRLGEAMRKFQVLDSLSGVKEIAYWGGQLSPDTKTFVVCHDWAKVLGEVEGEFTLPFEECAFEFKINGRVVIILAAQVPGADPTGFAYYESKVGNWLRMKVDRGWWDQIRAACVMLDAEVATHTVTRIATKMNEKRAKAGKTPMYDFHTIDLAKHHKTRAEPGPGNPTGKHVRLHFVRGHWRHFETGFKTWVKWHLRGDPDLGFIDKNYRL